MSDLHDAGKSTWNVVAASVRGPGHEADGTPGQDAAHHRCVGDWLVAVVCDGAGSAARSDEGARHAARVVTGGLTEALSGLEPADLPSDAETMTGAWAVKIAAMIEAARGSLPAGPDGAVHLPDFHATLVGVIAQPAGGLFFHLGDGVGVATNAGPEAEDWTATALSRPENGAFANETFFYTEPHWREHLRFTPFAAPFDLITLLTDGAAAFALARTGDGLDPQFIAPVSRYLDQADPADGRAALAGTLDSAEPRRISPDDKTLLWARLLPGDVPAAAEPSSENAS